ncbi:MAG: carbohydrate kinase family protein [Candidatus Thermoplasmatota archaeon]|nr:carbohydrate kinase family protein [Candidatus Thermoplasmatota archaeon]
MENKIINELLKKLDGIEKEKIKEIRVTLMPDFFVDHFLLFESFEKDFFRIQKIYKQGGGNVPGIAQRIHQGGNAANTALALSKLGLKVHLICKTDKLGKHLLEFFFKDTNIDLRGIKTDGEIAITTAMEFGKNHSNVLVGDTGSVSNFDFDVLDEYDLKNIEESKLTGVLNWSLNKCGTSLAKKVFGFAKEHNVKTFMDTGDPSHRKEEIPDLIKNVVSDRNLDIFGINENELIHFIKGNATNTYQGQIDLAKKLKKSINARVDLHTASFSCTIDEKCTVMPTMKFSNIYRATGAGDTWNAGNIFGELVGLNEGERLLFANMLAGHYISIPNALHSNLEEIKTFIRKISNDTIY